MNKNKKKNSVSNIIDWLFSDWRTIKLTVTD